MLLPGAALFAPGTRGRGFRDWVAVPIAQQSHWLPLVRAAIDRADELELTTAP